MKRVSMRVTATRTIRPRASAKRSQRPNLQVAVQEKGFLGSFRLRKGETPCSALLRTFFTEANALFSDQDGI